MKVRAALALLPKRDPELFFIEAYISRGDISFLFLPPKRYGNRKTCENRQQWKHLLSVYVSLSLA